MCRSPTAGSSAGRPGRVGSCRRRAPSTARCCRTASRCRRRPRSSVSSPPTPRTSRRWRGTSTPPSSTPSTRRPGTSPRTWARCSPRCADGPSTPRRGRWPGGGPTTSRAGDRGAPSPSTRSRSGPTTCGSGSAASRTCWTPPTATGSSRCTPSTACTCCRSRSPARSPTGSSSRWPGVGEGRVTSSLRTLDLGGGRHLKVPLGVTTLGSTRLLGARSLDFAQRGERVLRDVLAADPDLAARVAVADETDLGRLRPSRRLRRVRRPPRAPRRGAARAAAPDRVLPGAARRAGRARVGRAAGGTRRSGGGVRGGRGDAVVEVGIGFLRHGVLPEMHGQNVLLDLDAHSTRSARPA